MTLIAMMILVEQVELCNEKEMDELLVKEQIKLYLLNPQQAIKDAETFGFSDEMIELLKKGLDND